MKVTPMDIQEQQFKTVFRGYERNEVDAFLDLVSKNMEDLIRENSYVKEELDRLNAEIERLKEMEDTLKNTVIAAQKMSEDFKENARKESDNIVAAARVQAEKIMLDAENRVSQLNAELGRINGRVVEIKEVIKGMLTGFLENMDKVAKRDESR
jgi:cell division initiation protein